MLVRLGALCALLWLSQPLSSQVDPSQAAQELDPVVAKLAEQALAMEHPESQADALWQAAAAAHGEVRLLVEMMTQRIHSKREPGASRLLCGVLRYQGQPQKALRILDGIPVAQRTNGDLLLRAELLDTLSRGDDAARAYDELLAKDLEPTLRRRILFRRALVGSDSIKQLKAFAESPELDREQRNQAAIILALRNEPAAALELYEVQGEGTVRFRQLVRLAEWALAAKDYKKSQEFGWEAVQVAKMKRDRRYALTVVVSAYRADKEIDALLKRLEASPELKDDARQVWIDLLRDEGRVEDALRLFKQGGNGDVAGQWTPALRRQLLEICRETGREDVLISQFRELMKAEPDNLEWRSGLSRHFLENGDREQAKAAWADFGDGDVDADRQLEAAYALMDLGLDDLALRAAGIAAKAENLRETAQLFVVKLHVDRGRFDEASAMLKEVEGRADGQDAVLAEVAGIYERMDRLDRAVAVLDRMRAAFGGFLGTDLDMKYALLLSKVDREHDALTVWRSLWTKVRSTPRGRYVEDRMMTVAARLGVLAKIAIELEDKLDAGTADTTDVELLVRLYVKVGDSAAATEITEQALRTSNASDIDIIRRKATIYLACQDYLEYERLIEQLIERDTENRLDHMRELTLSRLERGRRAQAIEKLPALRAAEDDSGIADEFEAGIYQLAGLKEPALKSYVKGLGRFPDRIDTHLLVANLMRETGREMEAARRFQYLASTAKRDDLFTIAIDGILNLRAQDDTQVPTSVVDWAMRVTLERLAERSHRFYLHRLAADLAEEMNDMPMSIRTLTAGIPVAGERRTALLREILGKVRSLDKNARVMFGGSRRMQISPKWDAAPYVMIGRRLLGQGEVVPPQVYMDLAAVFLHVKAVPDAMRTFSRAAELLDRGEVHRQAAAVLEEAQRYDGALQFYRRLLSVDANDVGLLVKIGRLEELAGRDEAACSVYEQGLAAALRQTAPRVHVAMEEEPDPDDLSAVLGRQRSVDAITTAMPKLLEGLLVTMPEKRAVEFVADLQQQVLRDLKQVAEDRGNAEEGAPATIDQFPRLATRADILRRLCLCYRQLPIADAVDTQLLQLFPTDRALAKSSIGYRVDRGFHVSAGRLTEASEFRNDPDFAWLASSGDTEGAVPPAIAAARVVPLLVEDPAKLHTMLDNIDAAAFEASNLSSVPVLLSACAVVGAADAGERIARAGVRIAATLNQREQIMLGRNNAAVVINLASRLNPELKERLRRYRLERTAAKGPKALISIQYELEGQSGMSLDADVIEQMLRSEVANSAQEQYGLRSMGLLFFLPIERRAALVRELYTAAPASQRLNVLSQGSDFVEEPLSEGYIDWFAAVFEREFAETDKRQRRNAGFSYSLSGSTRLKRARLEVAIKLGGSHREWLRLLQLVKGDGDVERAKLMLEEGIPSMLVRDDLAGIVPNRPKALNKRQVEDAIRQISNLGLRDVAAEIVEAKLKKSRRHEALLFMQWLLRTEMPGATAFVAEASKSAKPSKDLLERKFQFEEKRGRLVEASETLQQLIEVDKGGAKRWRSRLASLHSRLSNPEAAKKLRGAGGGSAGAVGRAAVRSVPGAAVVVQALSVVGQPVRAGRVGGELAKLEDDDKGRLSFRRKWRGQANNWVIYSPLFPRANISLAPRDLEAVSDKGFVADEARRMLRVLEDSGQLGSDSLLGALLQTLPKGEDAAATCEHNLELLAGGNGGIAESVSLLVSLATDELPDELRERVVASLLTRREVPDEARMRSIAHELVRMKRTEPAALLYRLAVLAASDGQPSYLMRGQREKPADVIKAVQEKLGGELGRTTAVAMVDDKLAVSEDADMVLAALESWQTLLSDEQLQERVLNLHQKVSRLREGRRSSYTFQQKAVPLAGAFCQALLRAGKTDEAMGELSHLLCAPVPDMYGRTPRRNGRGAKQQIEELLAIESPKQAEWLKRITEQAIQWHQEGKLDASVEVLGTLGVKAGEAGLEGLAAACADQLAVLAADDTLAERQLAYLRRAAGDEEGAWLLEKKMLAQRRLAIRDHSRVLKELHTRDGVAVAFAAGNKALGYTSHSDVLQVMIGFAEELSEAERAQEWRDVLESRKPKKPAEKAAAAPKAERG